MAMQGGYCSDVDRNRGRGKGATELGDKIDYRRLVGRKWLYAVVAAEVDEPPGASTVGSSCGGGRRIAKQEL